MDLLEVARVDPDAAAELGGIGHGRRGSVEGAETPLGLRHDGAMLDGTCRRDDHIGRPIIAAEIGAEPRRVERADARGRAQNRTPDRLPGERGRLQVVEHDVVGRVLRGPDLLHDDVLLARELFRIERRIGQNVGEHVERQRHVGPEHARIIGGHLHAGRRVEIAADRLDLLGDLPGGAPRRALERHVLQEMRDAVLVLALVAAAAADPHAERGGFEVRHGIGDDHEAGRKTRQLHAHAAAPYAARLVQRMKC